jgi:ABC-type branched-subunit amino acid transport system substrate-binding protein
MRKIPILFVIYFAWLLTPVACDGIPNNSTTSDENSGATPTNAAIYEGNSGDPNEDASGDEKTPDLTGETIVIYLIGNTAPPFTSITDPMRDGAQDYVTYLNEEGGVFGATVELRYADTGGSEEGVVTAYDRFSNGDENILIMLLYSSYEEMLYEQINEDHIPVLTFGLNPGLPGVDEGNYIFHLTPTYAEQFAFFLDFILDQWEEIKPGGAIDEIKVAYLGWGNEYGQSALTEETRTYAESRGIEIVWEEYLEMTSTTSTTAAIFNAEMAGATVIYANMHEFGPANLLNDLHNLAIRDFFIVGGNNWAMDATMFDFLSEPIFAEDFYIPTWYAWWTDKENPGIQFAEEILVTNERGEREKTTGRLLIQGGIDLARYAIEQAILEVGYESISGDEIYQIFQDISSYEIMGGLSTVDFTDGKRSPTLLQMRQVQGDTGKLMTVEEFSEIPDLNP